MSDNDILWYQMSDAQKSIFITQELLGWRKHPDLAGMWIPAVRRNDDFADAAQRPAVTLPRFASDRNSIQIVERFVMRALFFRDPPLILQAIQGFDGTDYTANVRFIDSHNNTVGTGEGRGKHAYCEAVLRAALRTAKIEVITQPK